MSTRSSRFLIFSALLAVGFAYGYFFHRNHVFPYYPVRFASSYIRSYFRGTQKPQIPPGLWFRARDSRGLIPEQQEEIEKLNSIGYTSGNRPASNRSGVRIYDRDAVSPGFNYYTSGHAPEVTLMDMEGKQLHRWRYEFQRFWPGRFPKGDMQERANLWQRAYLYENGDLLAIYEGLGLIKLDKDSNLLWGYRGGAHHDMDVLPDGTIYLLTRRAHIVPYLNPVDPILEDFITILNPQGKVIKEISIPKSFASSPYAPILQRTPLKGDIFHTNTVHVLDGRFESRAPFLKKGNVLISLCLADTIAILNPDSEKIVWALSGMWRKQHRPIILADGNLLLFDNQGLGTRSRVMEFDLLTQQILWSYEADNFYSPILGSCQNLPNGNIFITESLAGRAFEVARDKRVLWEFLNPHRAGKNGEFVAVVPQMTRIPIDFPLDWLTSKTAAR